MWQRTAIIFSFLPFRACAPKACVLTPSRSARSGNFPKPERCCAADASPPPPRGPSCPLLRKGVGGVSRPGGARPAGCPEAPPRVPRSCTLARRRLRVEHVPWPWTRLLGVDRPPLAQASGVSSLVPLTPAAFRKRLP